MNTKSTNRPHVTDRTSDVIAWREAWDVDNRFIVEHTPECDRLSCGDECIGGCFVVVE